MKRDECSLCERFERLIRRSVTSLGPQSPAAEGWRDAYALHRGLDHFPRQLLSDQVDVMEVL